MQFYGFFTESTEICSFERTLKSALKSVAGYHLKSVHFMHQTVKGSLLKFD